MHEKINDKHDDDIYVKLNQFPKCLPLLIHTTKSFHLHTSHLELFDPVLQRDNPLPDNLFQFLQTFNPRLLLIPPLPLIGHHSPQLFNLPLMHLHSLIGAVHPLYPLGQFLLALVDRLGRVLKANSVLGEFLRLEI